MGHYNRVLGRRGGDPPRRPALILRDDRLLLVNAYPDEESDLWCVPGGARNPSSLPDNLIREVHEETGLPGPCPWRRPDQRVSCPGARFHQVDIFFRCRSARQHRRQLARSRGDRQPPPLGDATRTRPASPQARQPRLRCLVGRVGPDLRSSGTARQPNSQDSKLRTEHDRRSATSMSVVMRRREAKKRANLDSLRSGRSR